MECRWIEWGSPEYESMLDLRRRILRHPLGLDFTPAQIEEEKQDSFLVAYVENDLCGCLVLTQLSDSEIKMRQVAVEKSCQGKGVGTFLVLESERAARARGFQKMTLNARETAMDFYLRMDYLVVGEPFIEVGVPHRKMLKIL